MSFEPVNVQVADQMSAPVPDVMVKVYNADGTVFFSQATTDPEGKAGFLLETLDYSMRFYKFQVGFSQPQLFSVLPAPGPNTFDVVAEPFDPPVAQDPRLCKCSGFFRDLDGSAKCNLDMHFVTQFDPVILDDAAIITGERHVRTDENGFACIDLIRGANYIVNIEAVGAFQPRCVSVPDLAGCNLPDLLFPIVEKVVLPGAPYALTVLGTQEVVPEVYDSSGRPLEEIASDVVWKMADPTIASVITSGNKLTLKGISAGTTQLTAERKDQTIIKIPNTPIEGQPVDVVVS